jgi:hypothetical protein
MSYPEGTIAGMTEARPALTNALSGAELSRWYWTLAELFALARAMGVPRGGGKAALTERLAAALDGVPAAPPPRRAPVGRQLTAPVSAATVIPPGQRCSQVLREHFRQQIGPAFTFDEFMRTFITQGAGRTLGEAVTHWHATRAAAAAERPISPQFELNAFLRQWRQTHPGTTRQAALSAWQHHRSQPADQR